MRRSTPRAIPMAPRSRAIPMAPTAILTAPRAHLQTLKWIKCARALQACCGMRRRSLEREQGGGGGLRRRGMRTARPMHKVARLKTLPPQGVRLPRRARPPEPPEAGLSQPPEPPEAGLSKAAPSSGASWRAWGAAAGRRGSGGRTGPPRGSGGRRGPPRDHVGTGPPQGSGGRTGPPRGETQRASSTV
ncbi:hypothetical protein T484DRAFT_1919057, partial [Baffinella frigidus]